jgi:hypothetical protein
MSAYPGPPTGLPLPGTSPMMLYPYGCYPSPYRFAPWTSYSQPSFPFLADPSLQVVGAINSTQAAPPDVEYPLIGPWLEYCDRLPQRLRDTGGLGLHAYKFEHQGFRCINQFISGRISVEKLSDWLVIGKGTADLIIQYAEEDMKLLHSGKFMMDLPAQDDVSSEWS